ncbi:MAG TPA: FGGY family carbohydrate kinase, partial [Thermomicrobiales bacterium]|nr:FGGY family carbohydrate kinase [Thermomicrobiales bacterium]
MAVSRAYLGLDLGTSAIKALVVEESGRVLGSGSAEYPILHPHPGRAEQDPDDWWRATVTATRQAMAGASAPAIAAIGISGQMHGTALLDAEQRPLGPAIIWMDQRSGREVDELTELIGREPLIRTAGSPLATGFQAATLRWLQRHEPGRWGQVRRILLPKDELRRRL